MAKFCTRCGKPLEEGVSCSCQKKEFSSDALSKSKESLRNVVNLFLEIGKGMFKSPADTIKKYSTKENVLFGIIAIVISSLITGILFYCMIKEGILSIGYFGAMLEVSLFKVVLQGLLFMGTNFLITALSIYLISTSLFQEKLEFQKIVSMVGVCSVFTTITTIATIVLVFLSLKLALFVLLIITIFYLTYVYQGITEITKLNKNKLAYVFVPSIMIALFVVTYILPKILF